MAEKKLERTYIIPLRKYTVKVARWRRAKKSIGLIKKFMKRHMKSDNILIGQELNQLIWARGGKVVPNKVEVKALREEGIVKVNLIGSPLPGIEKKPEKKKETKKEEPKKEEKKEEKPKQEKKEEPKEEKKEVKKEEKPEKKEGE